MNKVIIFLVLILGSLASLSQPVSYRSNGVVTVSDARLQAQYNLFLPRYKDTAQANLQKGIDSCGAIIYTSDNVLWQRSCDPKRWTPVSNGSNFYGTQLISGNAIWDSLYIFNVTRCTYYILGRYFTSLPDTVHLAASNPTNPRIDVIYLDTLGNVGVITGVPSANPSKPVVNPVSQIELTHINVAANSTSPSDIRRMVVYNENTQLPTEWNTSTTAIPSVVNFNYTTNPYVGTKSLFTSNQSPKFPILFSHITPINADTTFLMSMFFRMNSAEGTAPHFYVILKRAGVFVTDKYAVSAQPIVGSYQQIVIPLNSFVFTSSNHEFDQISIYNISSATSGYQYDYITLQFGGNPTPNTSNYWSLDGNDISSSPSSRLGTTSSDSLNIITNDITRIVIGSNGIIKFPNIQTNSDTSTYKPVGISASGEVTAMNNWVGGNTPNLQQVTDVGASTTNMITASQSVLTTEYNKWDAGNLVYYPFYSTDGSPVFPIESYIRMGNLGGLEPEFYNGTSQVGGSYNRLTPTYLEFGNSGTAVYLRTPTINLGNDDHYLPVSDNTPDTLATTAEVATKLNITDTANMLINYLRKVDTASLSSRINLKLNISDTATMLTPYLRKIDTASLSSRIDLRVRYSDTAAMLTPYLRKIDTASLSSRIDLRVRYSDTAAMLTPYLRKIDTTGKFVNNITRTAGKDSIIFFIGGTRYAIKDSVGGGGGSAAGSTGNIQFNSSGAFAGSNNLFWDNTNSRLGIGTTSPTVNLNVVSSTNTGITARNTSTSGRADLLVTNDAGNVGGFTIYGSAFGAPFSNNVAVTSFKSLGMYTDGGVINGGTSTMDFITGGYNNSPTMRITGGNTGNVLIGTTTDAGFKLDVNGTARAVTSLQTPQINGNTTSGANLTLQSTTNATKGKILFGTSAYDEVNNRLGIGTASPTTDINLSKSVNGFTDILNYNSSTGTSAFARFIAKNDANNEAQLYAAGSNWSGYGSMTGNACGFYSSLLNGIQIAADGNFTQTRIQFMTGTLPSTKMVIQNNGNVQIGTTTDAGFKLDVNGTTRLNGSTTLGSTGFWDNTNTRLGIGTTSPSNRFHLTGSITASAGSAVSSNINPTLVAAANNDRLVGLDINPTFTNGAFTGVWNVPLRVSGDVIIGTDITTLNSASFVNEKVFIGRNGSGTSNGFLGLLANNLAAPTAGISTGALLGFNASTTNFYGQGLSDARNSKFDMWFQTGAVNGGGYRFYTGTQENVTIFDNGNMLLQAGGTKTNAGFRLDVNGTTRLNGNTTLGNGAFWDNTNNRLGIGLSAANATLQVSDNGGGQRGISVDSYNSSGFEASFVMRSARGTMASPSQTLNGDGLGFFGFRGYSSGGAFLSNSSAYVEAYAIDNFTNTAGGARLVFATTPSGSTTSAVNMTINGNGNIQFPATNTAAGTTGNQTINKTSGTVNIAAAGTSITVTNNLVTTSSIVFAVIRTNDATAEIKNVVPAAGSFTINLNAAATAETSIGFFVIN